MFRIINGKPVLQFQQPSGPIEPGNVGADGIRDTLLFAQNGSGGQVRRQTNNNINNNNSDNNNKKNNNHILGHPRPSPEGAYPLELSQSQVDVLGRVQLHFVPSSI